jgi:hypothetical protein
MTLRRSAARAAPCSAFSRATMAASSATAAAVKKWSCATGYSSPPRARRRNSWRTVSSAVPLARNTSRTRGGLNACASSRGLSTANRSRSAAETLAACPGRCSQARVCATSPVASRSPTSTSKAARGRLAEVMRRRRSRSTPARSGARSCSRARASSRRCASASQRVAVKPSRASPSRICLSRRAPTGLRPPARRGSRPGRNDPDRRRPGLSGQQHQRRQRIVLAQRGQQGEPLGAALVPRRRKDVEHPPARHAALGARHRAARSGRRAGSASRVRAGSRPARSPQGPASAQSSSATRPMMSSAPRCTCTVCRCFSAACPAGTRSSPWKRVSGTASAGSTTHMPRAMSCLPKSPLSARAQRLPPRRFAPAGPARAGCAPARAAARPGPMARSSPCRQRRLSRRGRCR